MLIFLVLLASLTFRMLYAKDTDVPYIACDVCKKAVEKIFNLTMEAKENAPYKKLKSITIDTILETMCLTDTEAGKWIMEQDIVNSTTAGGAMYLQLITPGGQTRCKEECKALTKSCEKLFDEELDMEECSLYIFKRQNELELATLQQFVCNKMSKRCNKPPIALPKTYAREDEEFVRMTARDYATDDAIAEVQKKAAERAKGPYDPTSKLHLQNIVDNMEKVGKKFDDAGNPLKDL